MKLETKKMGVAVIGLGVGEQHALAYLAHEHCELRWFYDLDRDKSKGLAAKLRTGEMALSLEDILWDDQTQVVSIASYDDVHYEQVVRALEAGKHVFVEKPLCTQKTQLQNIKRLWQKYDGKLKLSSNLVLRSAPLYRWLKAQIEEGSFGKLYSFDGEYLFGRIHKITREWRKDVENYSVTLGGGVHLVDLMLWFVRERPTHVSAFGNKICTQGSDFRYDDFVTLVYQFPSGLIGRISSHFGCVHPHQHGVRLFGTKATFFYDDGGARLQQSRETQIKAEAISYSPLPKTKGELIPDFVAAILNEKNLKSETQEMFDVMSVCLAADEALKTNAKTEIEYI